MYQARTLSGNPLTMTTGNATLKELQKAEMWDNLLYYADQLETGWRDAAEKAGVSTVFQRVGTMFTTFF